MDTPQTLPQRAFWAVPRAVWLGAAAFGIAAVSAGAAMWLQPKLAGPEQVGTAVPAKASTTNAATNMAAAKPAAKPVATAAACDHCGVVESVRTYQRKGEGSGVGAVAGGVLGAVVGNQVGKGNGRAAMTAIGAVGGGFAGNEIEKRTKSTTVTEVRVRMDDGTLRTFEPQQALRAGERVVVQGNAVHLAPAGG